MHTREIIRSRLPRSVDLSRWIDADTSAEGRAHLTRLLTTFNDAVFSTLGSWKLSTLSTHIGAIDELYRPYAIEGSGMGFALLAAYDLAGPTEPDPTLLASRTARRLFSLGVGMGSAFVGRDPSDWPAGVRGVVLERWGHDGFGFYQSVLQGTGASQISQASWTEPWCYSGLGRALWFRHHSDPRGIDEAARRTPSAAQQLVWHGVGLAAGFSGGASQRDLESLCSHAGPQLAHLQRGALTGLSMRRGTESPALTAAFTVFAPRADPPTHRLSEVNR